MNFKYISSFPTFFFDLRQKEGEGNNVSRSTHAYLKQINESPSVVKTVRSLLTRQTPSITED